MAYDISPLIAAAPESDEAVRVVCHRVLELRDQNQAGALMRSKIRDIMNGGPRAVQALLGPKVRDPDIGLPVANLMLSAGTRLAQKLGRRPDIKVDPPTLTDSEAPAKAAEKRARIVETYDDVACMDLQLPQIGRWVPGYGFHAWVLRQRRAANGDPYPVAEMRDPFDCYPAEWGVDQQPADLAFCRRISVASLVALFPNRKDTLDPRANFGGAVILDSMGGYGQASWSSQSGVGVDVYEYMSRQGTWWVLPAKNMLLSYQPNPMSSAPFFVAKRFSFDQLTGQYDHIIGLMANIARLNLLATIATEDSVMAETIIVGDLAQGNAYNRGRNAVNYLTPGSSIQKMNQRVPFETFQQVDRIERQLRLVAGYPVTDDGQSPNSFVTGRGLEELSTSVSLEVREYQTVLRHSLEALDAKRLEWDEAVYGGLSKTMEASRQGAAFSETYVPRTHIGGKYRTRRVYGAMAAFDDATKIVTGLQLMQGEIIDADTMRENIDGLENHAKIKERIRSEKAEKVVFDSLLAMAGQGDPRAVQATVDMLPAGEFKDRLAAIFAPAPAPADQQQAPGAVPGQPQPPAPGGPPPDVQTVLERLSGNGQATANVQTIGQVA